MHLSNSIHCVVQGKFWWNFIPCCQPYSLNSPNHCNSAPKICLTPQKFIPINMSTIHLSGSLPESATSLILWNKSWEYGMCPSPDSKPNHSRPKSFQNWEAYSWKEPSHLSNSPTHAGIISKRLHLSLTLLSLMRNSPVPTWCYSSGDQELSLSLGSERFPWSAPVKKALLCTGLKALFLSFLHTLSFCPLGVWKTSVSSHSQYPCGDSYNVPVSLLAYRPDIFISFNHSP